MKVSWDKMKRPHRMGYLQAMEKTGKGRGKWSVADVEVFLTGSNNHKIEIIGNNREYLEIIPINRGWPALVKIKYIGSGDSMSTGSLLCV